MNSERLSSNEQENEFRWAVFVDRDGTIIDETGYLSDPDGVGILPNVQSALGKLNRIGVPVIVVSNQSGVARGMYTIDDVERVNQRMRDLLAAGGGRVDAIYFCPHHPDYDMECDCRKPRPGLLVAASKEWGISLGESFMIGDKLIDMQAGRAAGASTILVRTGDGQKELDAARAQILAVTDTICEDLPDAVEWILGRKGLRAE